jgi:hypothetical protein
MDGWGVLDTIASSIIDLLEVRLEVRQRWRRLRGGILRLEGEGGYSNMFGVPVKNNGQYFGGCIGVLGD